MPLRHWESGSTLVLDGGSWSISSPFRFTSGDTAASTRWMHGWIDPRVELDATEKRKISFPYYESNPGRPADIAQTNKSTIQSLMVNCLLICSYILSFVYPLDTSMSR
jgi:hypothetical protein